MPDIPPTSEISSEVTSLLVCVLEGSPRSKRACLPRASSFRSTAPSSDERNARCSTAPYRLPSLQCVIFDVLDYAQRLNLRLAEGGKRYPGTRRVALMLGRQVIAALGLGVRPVLKIRLCNSTYTYGEATSHVTPHPLIH